MAVDPKVLENCIVESAGDDAELAEALRAKLIKNDALAAKFVAGFMRSSDYTQKTQALADERKTFTSQAEELKNARAALTAAESEKNQILQDLSKHRVSTAKARELMLILRDKYDLNDADLPGMSDLIETAKKGKPVDSTDDLDTRLATLKADIKKEVEADFVKTMMPELGSMAALPMIWQEINREHQELTGKALTFAEQQDILKSARAGEGSLRDVWEKKYQIAPGEWGDGMRMQKRDEKLKQTWESDREKKDAEDRSKRALEVVSGPQKNDLGEGPGISAAFKTRFKQFEMDPNKAPVKDAGGVPSLEVKPGQHVRQDTGNRIPASQRAAAKFLEQHSKAS
jgi:hypothetical protein